MPTVDSGGVTVAYDLDPPLDGETIAFVEGWSYGRWMWQWQRAAFESFATVVMDNRGTGESPAPGWGMPWLFGKLPERVRQPLIYFLHRDKYAMERLAQDLNAVLADIGVESAHVVGASMGGMVALQHALDHERTASLTLLCTTAGGNMAELIPAETRSHLENVPAGIDERDEIKYLMEPATTQAWREANADLLDDIVDWRLEQDASLPAREAQAMGQLSYDVRDRLDEITVPTLVMHGTGDAVVPLERGERLVEGLSADIVTFERFEDAPHLFFIERAEAVNEHLTSFIDAVETPADVPQVSP